MLFQFEHGCIHHVALFNILVGIYFEEAVFLKNLNSIHGFAFSNILGTFVFIDRPFSESDRAGAFLFKLSTSHLS